MTRRRVVVLGKNRLAVGCLDAVLGAGDEVVLAVADPGDDGQNGWQPSFRAAAERRSLPLAAPTDVNDPGFVASLEELAPDFVLSFQAAQIMRRAIIETARLAALNLHFGPLPRYRGVAPIAWAIINGEAATGVTLHHIDPGIDSGDIVASASVPIGAGDTGRTVYDHCTDAGIDLFRTTWPDLRRGTIERHPQDATEVLYYNRHSIDFGQRRISWWADARAIADRARALVFPPFQYPTITLGPTEYEVTGVTWDRGAHRGRPGEVLGLEGTRVMVAAPGGRVVIGPLLRDGAELDAAKLGDAGFATGVVLSSD